MKRDEQRAAAIEQRLAVYEEELNQTYDEDLPGFDLDVLKIKQQEMLQDARDEHIETLLERRRKDLEGMSDEVLLKDDDEELHAG